MTKKEEKKEEKKEDFFTKLGRTVIETFLKQWKTWSVKSRILFILAIGFGLITLFHLTDFILFILALFLGIFTSQWLLSVMEDIKKLKAQQPSKKEKNKNKE